MSGSGVSGQRSKQIYIGDGPHDIEATGVTVGELLDFVAIYGYWAEQWHLSLGQVTTDPRTLTRGMTQLDQAHARVLGVFGVRKDDAS